MRDGGAFFNAAKTGDSVALEALLTEDPSLLAFRGEGTADANIGSTAVHWTAAKGHADALALLLRAGGDPHARNSGDSTPLSSAVMAGHKACVSLLLAAHADPTLADEFGDSPLTLAQRAKRDDLVSLLSGAPLTAAPSPAAVPPPPSTAECKQRGNEAFAKKEYEGAIEWYTAALAGLPAPPAAPTEAAEAAAALYSNRSACFVALSAFEAALDDANRAVALRPQWAKAHSRVGAALYGQGVLDDALAAYTRALELDPAAAAASAQLKQIKAAIRARKLEELIERGAFSKRSDDADAPGAEASDAAGADAAAAPGAASARGGRSGTVKPPKTAEQRAYAASVAAWMSAAKRGEVHTLEESLAAEPWLLSNRCENTAESLLGNTALHWAAANGHASAVSWLLSRDGIDVQLSNHGGGTALHSAAAHGRASTVALLIEAGANTRTTDENGDTPRDAAMRRGYRAVEAVLDRGPSALDVRWRGGGAAERPASIEAAKLAGNAAFGTGSAISARSAVWHYTDALLLHNQEHAPSATPDEAAPAVDVSEGGVLREPSAAEAAEAVLLSNRSAAHATLYEYAAALDDASRAVALRPQWAKAHGRVGAALVGLGELERAEAAYREGLRHEPSAQLERGLAEVLKRTGAAAD